MSVSFAGLPESPEQKAPFVFSPPSVQVNGKRVVTDQAGGASKPHVSKTHRQKYGTEYSTHLRRFFGEPHSYRYQVAQPGCSLAFMTHNGTIRHDTIQRGGDGEERSHQRFFDCKTCTRLVWQQPTHASTDEFRACQQVRLIATRGVALAPRDNTPDERHETEQPPEEREEGKSTLRITALLSTRRRQGRTIVYFVGVAPHTQRQPNSTFFGPTNKIQRMDASRVPCIITKTPTSTSSPCSCSPRSTHVGPRKTRRIHVLRRVVGEEGEHEAHPDRYRHKLDIIPVGDLGVGRARPHIGWWFVNAVRAGRCGAGGGTSVARRVYCAEGTIFNAECRRV